MKAKHWPGRSPHQTGHGCRPDEIDSIAVTLEKHGAFYHPASVKVTTPYCRHPFVVNVAVSDEGRRIIDREFQLLDRLDPSKSGPQRVIPEGFYQHAVGPTRGRCTWASGLMASTNFISPPPQSSDPDPDCCLGPGTDLFDPIVSQKSPLP